MWRILALATVIVMILPLLLYAPGAYRAARGEIIISKEADYSVATPAVTADTAMVIPGASETRTVSVSVSNAGPSKAEAEVTISGSAPSGCTATPAGDHSGTGVGANGEVNLSPSTATIVSRDFIVSCTVNGDRTFVYSASVSVVPEQSDGFPAEDPDTSTASNGPKTVQQTVVVTGVADLAIVVPTVTVPGGPPQPNADFTMTVATTGSNSGFSPANGDVTLSLIQSGGSDCIITAGSYTPPIPLSLGPDTNVSRDFTVNCSALGQHSFQSSANTTLAATDNVVENNLSDNGPLNTSHTMDVAFVADLVISISSAIADPDVVGSAPGVQHPVSCSIPCQLTVNTSATNLGPFGPVNADVTILVTPSTGCDAGAGMTNVASADHASVMLGGPTNLSDVFTVSCSTSGSKIFAVAATIALSPGQPDVDNAPSGDNAGPTNVFVAVLEDADLDGVPDSVDQCENLDEDRDGVLDGDGCPDTDATASVANFNLVGGPPTSGTVDIVVANGNYGPAANLPNGTTKVDLSVTVGFDVLPVGACTVTPLPQPADSDTSAVTVAGDEVTYSEEDAQDSSGSSLTADIIIVTGRTTTLSFAVSGCNTSLPTTLTVTACVEPTADTENASSPPSGEGNVCTGTNPGSAPSCCYRVDEEEATNNTGSGAALLVVIGDSDNDGVTNAIDRCPDTPQPTPSLDSTGFGCAQSDVDGDGDGFCDDIGAAQNGTSWCPISPVDNCPDVANPAQIDTDALLAAAGASIGGAPLPADGLGDACDEDDDNDGSLDALESYLGTDALDNCGFEAWPPDTNNDSFISAADFGLIQDSWQLSTGDEGFIRRADLSGDGTISAADFGALQDFWQQGCT